MTRCSACPEDAGPLCGIVLEPIPTEAQPFLVRRHHFCKTCFEEIKMVIVSGQNLRLPYERKSREG